MLKHGMYHGKSEDEIAAQLTSEGLKPRRVIEQPGSIYEDHLNPDDLLLVFVRGGANIRVGDRLYKCRAGDRLLINGQVVHSAVVGSEGCVYFMTPMPLLAD